MRSTYGDLLPVRVQPSGALSHTFIYPHDSSQPNAEIVLASFRFETKGFESALGRVTGDVYVGRDFAGGRAKTIGLRGGSLRFIRVCGFVAQLLGGTVTAIEADRTVTARWSGHTYRLSAYHPLRLIP